MKRAILFNIPLSICNMRCHYCYIAQRPEGYQGVFPEMLYSPEQVGYAMRQERLGGASFFNMTASGETLLLPSLGEYVSALASDGHFIEVVSNMTPRRCLDDVLSKCGSLLSHVEFKCSFHFLELERRGLLETFAENVNRAWEAGASITVEVTPSDELIPRMDEVAQFSHEHFGALPHLTIARDDRTAGIERLTELDADEYTDLWSRFDSPFFDFKSQIFGVRQRGFCYAGLWSCHADLSTGRARQCLCGSSIGNLFEHPDEPIDWHPIGRCQLPHCYNGHAFLTLGTIPEIDQLRYSDVRDRVRTDGEHWLRPELREFFGQRLEDDNERIGNVEKVAAIVRSAPSGIRSSLGRAKRALQHR